MKRGEIWWASLQEPRGSEPAYRRPVVIISANAFNQSAINTVIVAVLTSNLRLANAPANFKLTKKSTGLPRDSVVNVSQIMTLDKRFLTEKINTLNHRQIQKLTDGLQTVLAI